MAFLIDGPNPDFAMRLHSARRQVDMTQAQLAERVGVDKRTISQYETGHMRPRKNTLYLLADALQMDFEVLKTGKSKEDQEYFASQKKASWEEMPECLSLQYIEEWSSLPAGPGFPLPLYKPEGSYQRSDFIPIAKKFADSYRATRFPGMQPENAEMPAGTILIFDARVTRPELIENGDFVIFRYWGNENLPGLRRCSREPGMKDCLLLSLDPLAPTPPIPLDPDDLEILGVVLSQTTIHHQRK